MTKQQVDYTLIVIYLLYTFAITSFGEYIEWGYMLILFLIWIFPTYYFLIKGIVNIINWYEDLELSLYYLRLNH